MTLNPWPIEWAQKLWDQTTARPVLSQTTCDHCDGTGECWEACGCNQCEYGHHGHDRTYECPNCDGTGKAA